MAPRLARILSLLAVLVIPFGVAADAARAADVVDQVKAHSRFTIFARALEQTKYAEKLAEDGPYTVFAFTDHAFKRLPDSFEEYLFSPAGTGTLEEILSYHVIPGKATSDDMFGRVYEVSTLDGQTLTIEGHMDYIRVNGSTILEPDIMARNGVVHLLDYVIIPPHF